MTCSWATLASKKQYKSLKNFKESLDSGWGRRRRLFWIWQSKQNQHYVCAYSLFSLFVTDAGTSQRFREWPAYTRVQWGQTHNDFLLHNMKALQGKLLSHPMKLPGNGANRTPTQYLWLYDQNTTERAPCELTFAMTKSEQSSKRMTRAAGKGKRPQRSTGGN